MTGRHFDLVHYRQCAYDEVIRARVARERQYVLIANVNLRKVDEIWQCHTQHHYRPTRCALI